MHAFLHDTKALTNSTHIAAVGASGRVRYKSYGNQMPAKPH